MTEMKDRESGFYWVKQTTEWEVAQWYSFKLEHESKGYWFIVGDEYDYTDSDFKEIDEKQIIRMT